MKLHDNSRIRGFLIVLRPPANLFKTKGFIKIDSSMVGSSYLQENCASKARHKRRNECAPDPLPPELRRYGNVQYLAFPRPGRPGNEKACNPIVAYGHTKIVRKIVAHAPLG